MSENTHLNQRAAALCKDICAQATELRVAIKHVGSTNVIDLGIDAPGGLETGRRLAEVCLAGLGEVTIVPGDNDIVAGPAVMVRTDHPVLACMASQYAGWEIAGEDYFAMGSGPMRAAAAREELFSDIGYHEKSDVAVGVLETSSLPPESICRDIATKCSVSPEQLTLLAAPTDSQAGNIQVVARSVETALHKLHELGFDLSRIISGWGLAPLPPVAGDALTGIGRTNDAILYGGRVVLYVRGDDESLADLGAKAPSNASPAHGKPFKQIFAACDHDFYKIDKHLFSPAVVEFVNVDTGRSHRFGKLAPDVVAESFYN